MSELEKTKWVEKVWGGELWMVNTELYCVKYLFLQPGHQCSLHRHLVKDETFLVRNGEIELEYGDEKRCLGPNEQQRIGPGTWHRFTNHSTAMAIILEASTTHSDLDVERKEPSRKISGPSSSEQSRQS